MAQERALGYVRVSTDEQASKGHGLAIQRRAIEGYCKKQALLLVDVLSDQGISGANGLDTRDGLAAALARIERHEASVLVVYRFDRLARQLLVQLTVTDRLDKVGARVLSTLRARRRRTGRAARPDPQHPRLDRRLRARRDPWSDDGRPAGQGGRGSLRRRHSALRLFDQQR
ncbi:MAG TPA: recombinase family protein [Acidimicrobiales bacterium]|nr:recombinase family protein [Acidimicrobiales bacterium]